MIRNLKALGLALVAVFAMSSMAASAASAAPALTSTGPVTLDGTEVAGSVNALTAFERTVECPGSSFPGHKFNVTPHTFIPVPATTVTVTPLYSTTCSANGLKATVTTNGCDYVIHIGALIEAGKYKTTTDIVCPTGAKIEVHIYASATNENIVACTVKVPAQAGLTGGFVKNLAGGKLTLGGPVEGITATKEGLCGSEETHVGKEDVDVEIKGTNEGGTATEVSVSG